MKKKCVLTKENRKRISELMYLRGLNVYDRPEDWYPTMENIKSLDPNDEDDIEFMYWIYIRADAYGEKQMEVKEYIKELIKDKYDEFVGDGTEI